MSQSKSARRALGRGLSSLIPSSAAEEESGNEVVAVDIQAIKANPFQPRLTFADEEIAELAESIKTQGLLQPVLLRKTPAGYEIISGERRVRALRRLGRTEVPAIVKTNIDDKDMQEMALVENLQREDLDPIECARGCDRLLREWGLSHEELSQRLGKSRSAITNALRLLKLPAEVQEMIRCGQISAGHARALAALESAQRQTELAAAIVKQGLSVRAIEALVQKASHQGSEHARQDVRPDPDMESFLERLRYRLGAAVAIRANGAGKGKIVIRFESHADLNRITELLGA